MTILNEQTQEKITLTKESLMDFCGTEVWYKHPIFKKYTYTEGVQYVAEQGGAYWLLEKIFACQMCVAKLAHQPFVVWELKKNKLEEGAILTCTDGNENYLYHENIIVTDFPLDEIKFYLTDDVLLLPSEY